MRVAPWQGSALTGGRWVLLATVGLMPALPSLGGALMWAMALAGFIRLAMPPRTGLGPPNDIWVSILLVTGLNVSSAVLFGQPLREVSWFPLLALPGLMVAVRLLRVQATDLILAAAWGCLASLIWVLIIALRSDDLRASLGSNAIIFGETTLVLVLLAVCGAAGLGGDARQDRPSVRRTLYGLAALCGLGAAMIVGFRGMLITVPVFLVAMFGQGAGSRGRRGLQVASALIAASAVLAIVSVVGPKAGLFDRILLIQEEIHAYASGHVGFNSLGSRLVLWQAAWDIFESHPLFGVGVHRFHHALIDLRAQGLFPADVELFRHAHNSYLTVLAEYGILGWGVIAAALVIIMRRLGRLQEPGRRLGLYVLALWATMALTNDVLAHQSTLRAIVLVAAVCLAARPCQDRLARHDQDQGPPV